MKKPYYGQSNGKTKASLGCFKAKCFTKEQVYAMQTEQQGGLQAEVSLCVCHVCVLGWQMGCLKA